MTDIDEFKQSVLQAISKLETSHIENQKPVTQSTISKCHNFVKDTLSEIEMVLQFKRGKGAEIKSPFVNASPELLKELHRRLQEALM